MISYGKRWTFAFRAFFSLLFRGRLADDIVSTFVRIHPVPVPVLPEPAEETADRATQMLALLQRDGRLVDFLMEDLTTYADAQIGAAVRDVHSGCRQALSRYVTLAPVLDDEEGSTITLDLDPDPARVKIVGNLGGTTPSHGVLRHRGWEATRLDLPPLQPVGRTIVAPAEVEIT